MIEAAISCVKVFNRVTHPLFRLLLGYLVQSNANRIRLIGPEPKPLRRLLCISLLWLAAPSGATAQSEPVTYYDPLATCDATVLDMQNWNGVYSAGVLAEALLWTRAGVALKGHPLIDGNTIVDTMALLRTLCRERPGGAIAAIIEDYIDMWQRSAAAPPGPKELEACKAKPHWHKRGPALTKARETNLFLTEQGDGTRIDGEVRVLFNPLVTCDLQLFSDPQTGWPFTANLYALGVSAARAEDDAWSIGTILSTDIDSDHAWGRICKAAPGTAFFAVLEDALPENDLIGFPNGLDGFEARDPSGDPLDCPVGESGEPVDPLS